MAIHFTLNAFILFIVAPVAAAAEETFSQSVSFYNPSKQETTNLRNGRLPFHGTNDFSCDVLTIENHRLDVALPRKPLKIVRDGTVCGEQDIFTDTINGECTMVMRTRFNKDCGLCSISDVEWQVGTPDPQSGKPMVDHYACQLGRDTCDCQIDHPDYCLPPPAEVSRDEWVGSCIACVVHCSDAAFPDWKATCSGTEGYGFATESHITASCPKPADITPM